MSEPISEVATEILAAERTRRGIRKGVAAVASLVVIFALCAVGGTAVMLNGLLGEDQSPYAFGCGNSQPVDPLGPMPSMAELTEEQVRNAAIIIKVGQDLQVAPRGWVIGVATALQESRLINLPDLGTNNDHDSIGLFQQRPSQGWGTLEQLSDPAHQARGFFQKLVNVTDWQLLPLTVAAQRVQVSAYPDAYAKHEPLAAQVVDVLTGGASRAVGTELALRCAAGADIAASGWTVPVQGPIVSGFRDAGRPAHQGVDISVSHGTPVRAAAAGVVIVAACNASLGGLPYACDQDGSPSVLGCGWYVDILHAGRAITRYCHLMSRPLVTVGQNVGAGQVIGVSGSSGNSSGPHLHFEVHLNGDGSSAGAVNPVAFMNQVGAPLVPVA
jgi:murein DD-endopeptidase MepM/ murein hydrolase activator NlpD